MKNQFFKLTPVNEVRADRPLRGPSDVVFTLADHYGAAKRERVIPVFFNEEHETLGALEYIGTANRTFASVSEICAAALKLNSSAVLLFHTHPDNDDPKMSGADAELVHKLTSALDMLGIEFIDAIVVSPKYDRNEHKWKGKFFSARLNKPLERRYAEDNELAVGVDLALNGYSKEVLLERESKEDSAEKEGDSNE